MLELRAELKQQVKSMPDLSFYPEPYFLEIALENPFQFGQINKEHIARLVDIADLNLLSFSDAKNDLKNALKSKDPWERYWALIVCSTFGDEAAPFYKKAKKMLQKDPERLVSTRAAEFLELTGQMDTRPVLLDLLQKAESATEANLMLNTVALLSEVKPGFQLKVTKEMFDPDWTARKNSLVNERVIYLRE